MGLRPRRRWPRPPAWFYPSESTTSGTPPECEQCGMRGDVGNGVGEARCRPRQQLACGGRLAPHMAPQVMVAVAVELDGFRDAFPQSLGSSSLTSPYSHDSAVIG